MQCCKECKKRYMGCHSKCEDYLAAKAENERIKEEKHKQSVTDGYFVLTARKKRKKYLEHKKK